MTETTERKLREPRKRALPEGISLVHARACGTRQGSTCDCEPSFMASFGLGSRGVRQRATFQTLDEAVVWRARQVVAKSEARLRIPSKLPLRDAAEAFIEGAKEGAITNRSGERYKPSVVRSYEQALKLHVLPEIGARRLGELQSSDLQRLVEILHRKGLAAATIRNALNPVQAIYRRAMLLGEIGHNPCRGVVLPTIRSRRIHAGDPSDAAALIAAAPERDQCIWALAFYAGLRLGELRALRWEDVDLRQALIQVRRSWDDQAGEVQTKSSAGERDVPIVTQLLPYLEAQGQRSPWQPRGLVLGTKAEKPFHYNALYYRSKIAWAEAGLERITPHQARHSFASFLIAAGTDVKAVTEIMGHTSVRQSFDRYGHLLRGSHAATASRLGAFLDTAADDRD